VNDTALLNNIMIYSGMYNSQFWSPGISASEFRFSAMFLFDWEMELRNNLHAELDVKLFDGPKGLGGGGMQAELWAQRSCFPLRLRKVG
jgi:hypothetical protein